MDGLCLVRRIVPAIEGLEPRFSCSWVDVAEAVRKRRRSTLELAKNPFDSVPISVATELKSEASSTKRGLEVLGAIDEKDGGFDVVFFSQFAEEDFGQSGRGRRKEADMKQFVRRWIASGVQLELLVVDSNHCFVEGDLIRLSPGFGL